jgi:hypothetical protein
MQLQPAISRQQLHEPLAALDHGPRELEVASLQIIRRRVDRQVALGQPRIAELLIRSFISANGDTNADPSPMNDARTICENR